MDITMNNRYGGNETQWDEALMKFRDEGIFMQSKKRWDGK